MQQLALTPSRSLLAAASSLCSLLGLMLGGCQSPIQTYDGPALPDSEIARVIGLKRPSLFVAVAGPPRSQHLPESIYISEVDGEEQPADTDIVDLLPGSHVLTLFGGRFETNPDRWVASLVDIELDAKAGETYLVRAKLSEHQPPWSYRLLERGSKEVVASSEPSLEELDLVALPSEAEHWAIDSWTKTSIYAYAAYRDPAHVGGPRAQLINRERSTVPKDLTVEALRYRNVRALELDGFRVEDTDLDGERWLQESQTRGTDDEGRYRISVSVHQVKNGELYSIIYVTPSSGPEDHEAERRRDEWKARLLLLN